MADPAQMEEREQRARELAGDADVDRVIGSARSQWLPTAPRDRSAADVAAVPIAGAKFTAGTLLLLYLIRLGTRMRIALPLTLALVPVTYYVFAGLLRVPLPRGVLGW